MNLIALHLNYCIEPFYIDKNKIVQWDCILYHIYKTFPVLCEKSNTVSFASSRMKKILVFPALSKSAVKLICWIALGSASSACCLLQSIAVNW